MAIIDLPPCDLSQHQRFGSHGAQSRLELACVHPRYAQRAPYIGPERRPQSFYRGSFTRQRRAALSRSSYTSQLRQPPRTFEAQKWSLSMLDCAFCQVRHLEATHPGGPCRYKVPLVSELHWSKLVAGKHVSARLSTQATTAGMCVGNPWLRISIVVHLEVHRSLLICSRSLANILRTQIPNVVDNMNLLLMTSLHPRQLKRHTSATRNEV